MKIEIHITSRPIAATDAFPAEFSGAAGASVNFSGVVRDTEDGKAIAALEYEAYSPMAENQMRRILESLAEKFPCLAVRVIHRVGVIPAGETAIWVGVVSKHRGEAYALLTEFMNRLKVDVPIWKSRTLPAPAAGSSPSPAKYPSADAARLKINERCEPWPAIEVSLVEATGCTLRETVYAGEDFPSHDRSVRDGYAILESDVSELFRIVDTIHAAGWSPRQLKTGETVRVATGASLPCDNLRVVMQEDVERTGDQLKVLRRETAAHVRRRGEELKAGDPVLAAGNILNAGRLALLASAGCIRPKVGPRLRVVHFTTGDEIIPPEQKPQPGQIRDSNSILIRSLLHSHACDVVQRHLPEDFELAKIRVKGLSTEVDQAALVLISGGASVGEKDFTRALLEHLGFEIIFSRLNLRPGAPLIFGLNGRRAAFGLPGNPLSHFVCHHLFVAPALARMAGAEPRGFSQGMLATRLEGATDARETFWPARCELKQGRVELTPLPWRSSGDQTGLALADALLRVPANSPDMPAGTILEFLPVGP